MTVVAGESVDVQLRVNTEVLPESINPNEVTDGVPAKLYSVIQQTRRILQTYWHQGKFQHAGTESDHFHQE